MSARLSDSAGGPPRPYHRTMDANDGIAGFSRSYASEHAAVLEAIDHGDVAEVVAALATVRRTRRTLFLAGNGGSAATASHLVIDLTKGVSADGRAPIRCVCLADCVPAITAIANDLSYDEVFSAQLRSLGEDGDVLLVVTGSGRSPNVLRALEAAREMGVATIGLLGMGGGPALPMCDVSVVVPSDDYGVIEDVHMLLGHLATAYLREHD
jgi:D-sedoheptulose 7-phosphate isomerase